MHVLRGWMDDKWLDTLSSDRWLACKQPQTQLAKEGDMASTRCAQVPSHCLSCAPTQHQPSLAHAETVAALCGNPPTRHTNVTNQAHHACSQLAPLLLCSWGPPASKRLNLWSTVRLKMPVVTVLAQPHVTCYAAATTQALRQSWHDWRGRAAGN